MKKKKDKKSTLFYSFIVISNIDTIAKIKNNFFFFFFSKECGVLLKIVEILLFFEFEPQSEVEPVKKIRVLEAR